ncbi:MAG: LysE family translocator [Bradyrhizobium sp.]|nr:MAG: LysE family translocator [Bradyrhizobium sp.]
MSVSSLILFAAVYFAAAATPGPGIAALIARVVGHGLAGVGPFILGYVAGDLIWLAVAATGLAALAHVFAGAFLALKLAGAAYLLFIAWGMARASFVAGDETVAPPPATRGWRAFLGSLSLTLGNPKVIVFFLSIMPLTIDLKSMTPMAFLAIAAVAVPVLGLTLATYALVADRARALLVSGRARRLAQRAGAGVIASVAVGIAAR